MMKITVGRDPFLAELNILQGVVERKNAIPILSRLALEAVASNRIRIKATDLDVGIETECDAQVEGQGITVVPAKKLFDIVRSLPNGEILLEQTADKGAHWLRLRCAGSNFNIAGDAAEHFPTMPALPQTPPVVISAALLHSFISHTSFAITLEESRYALSGALIVLAGGEMEMVTTDGHRLAHARHQVDASRNLRVIVPKKALVELQKLLPALVKQDSNATVGMYSNDNHLFFQTGKRLLSSRVLAGQFPNYESVIPKGNPNEVVLNTADIASALRRSCIMAEDRTHGVLFDLSENTVLLEAKSPDSGEVTEQLAGTYKGESCRVRFNGLYMLDFLAVVGTEQVTLAIKDDTSPALLAPVGSNGFSCTVMPLRL